MASNENKAFKDALACICKEKCGFFEDLEKNVDHKYISAFESVGFITRGYCMKSKTWKKTKLADQYFREIYGCVAFIWLKLGF